MSKVSPYFDPKILLDMGQELGKRPSRWDMELDGFTENELGRTVRVPARRVTNAAAAMSAFKWVARVTTKPEAARDWTITLGPLSPGNSLGPFQPTDSLYRPPNVSQALCLVQWSGGRQGAPSFAFVDWWSGQQFSVFGSRVVVSGSVLVLASAAAAIDETHVLSGQLAPGLSRNMPRLTQIYPTPIAAGSSVVQAVPPFARNVSASLANATAMAPTDLLLEGELISGGTVIWQALPFVLGGGGGMSPLANFRLPIGTNFIRATNNSAGPAVAALQLRLLYDLGLS